MDLPQNYQHAYGKATSWNMVPLHPNTSIIESKWVFSVKLKSDGSIDRYKTRLVAQGYKQKYRAANEETFTPATKLTTIMVILTVSSIFNWTMHQKDVKIPFCITIWKNLCT